MIPGAETIQSTGGRTPMTAIAVTQFALSLRIRHLLAGGFGTIPLRFRVASILAVVLVAGIGLPFGLAPAP
jgi:hypothetical protein